MKNIILLLTLLTVACSTPQKTTKTPITITPTKIVSLVNVISTSGFTEKEKVKLNKYIPVMNSTIASQCFKDFMVARALRKTNDKTNEQIVEDLRTSTVDIHLITYAKYYGRGSKVKGYTYPSANKIWLNRKYHAGATLCSEASNLAHELSHKLKYGHDFKASRYRPLSVPYSINAAFKVCCIK